MTFRKFAFNNVMRNKRLYAAYFLSSMFTVMVFFAFSIFAFHPTLTGGDMSSSVMYGMNVASGIIYVFSFFFVLYSMSSFLQSRKREFGLLMIQGMSMKQIRTMVFLENMVIGFFATVGGIILGLVFSKAILLLAENVLIIDGHLEFYLPVVSIILTFVSFTILFFVISMFVSYLLRSKKLIELIKGNKKSKGEPKASILLTIFAALLIATGYTVALLAKGLTVVAVMLPVVVVVIIGTYLFFTQLSVYVIRKLKKRESIFWNKTNMILFSDLSFRMKDNARTFFLVAIVSTVAFCAIGTLYGFQTFTTAGAKITNPFTYSYDANMALYEDKDVELIKETIAGHEMEAEEAQTTLRYHIINEERVLVAKESQLNHFKTLLGEEKVELSAGELFVVKYEGLAFDQSNRQLEEGIVLKSGEKLKPEKVIESRAFPAMNSYYVVSDEDYEKMPDTQDENYYHVWQVTDGEEHILEAGKELSNALPFTRFQSGDYQIYQINKSYAGILFVGLFIGIVFFVSAGSFLYFRLYSDVDEDKQKFASISKMGLSDSELKKILSRQTAILFFAPIVVALIHGAVALTALAHMFEYNLFKESVTVLGVFLLIQVVYFFIVRFYYTKQIRTVIS